MRPGRLVALALALAPTLMPALVAAQSAESAILERFSRLDQLPRYKRIASIGMFSSYDRTGGNDDGFNGTHSFMRKEAGGLVIAEMTGPGAITRIWTPTPTDDIVEFYIDGETTPRISEKFIDLFSGKRFPFVAPVSGIGAGGYYTYVPIAYAKSIKVVVKAERVNFYQLNYETYAKRSAVASYRPGASAELRAGLEKAGALLNASGSDVSAHAASGRSQIRSQPFKATVAPGGRATLFQSDAPGRIVALKLGPAAALAGPDRAAVLNVYYDGEAVPSISAPAADFFGYAWGEPALKSLLLGTANDQNYFYMPMPFDRSVRVELASNRTSGEIEVQGEVKFTDEPRRNDEGRLYAVWRRENPTTAGKPFTFLDTRGRGHIVGAILQAQGDAPGAVPEFFEGDDVTAIDGAVRIRGTGSEDFFNGGWYDVPGRWDGRVSLPLSGSLGFKRHQARTGGYRLFVSDPYPFKKSIVQTIEHGPVGNKLPTDYASMTFLYSDTKPTAALDLAPVASRAVKQPKQVVFTPGWTTPIRAFSWANASLVKTDEPIGGEDLRHLQFRATGREVFGPHYLMFDCEMPEAGRYEVFIQAIAGPAQGRVQLFQDEVPMGSSIDLYAATRSKTAERPMGSLTLSEGSNPVMFKIVGKDDRSSGLGFDVYRIIFRKVG